MGTSLGIERDLRRGKGQSIKTLDTRNISNMASTDKFDLIYLIADTLVMVRRDCEAIALALTYRKPRKPPPEAYRRLQVILPIVELTLDKVSKRAAADQLDPLTLHRLLVAAEACKHKIEELSDALRKVRPGSTREKVRRMFKPAVGRARRQKILDVAEEIVECDVKVAEAGEIAPSEEEAASIFYDKEVRMDVHFDDVVRRMVGGTRLRSPWSCKRRPLSHH